MDGLAFYRLTQVPDRKPRKRKVETKQDTTIDETGVEYYCGGCGKINLVNSTSSIQCRYCDWRILEKGKKNTVTLKAV